MHNTYDIDPCIFPNNMKYVSLVMDNSAPFGGIYLYMGETMMKEHLPQPSWCLDIADSGGTTYQLLSSGFALPSNTEADPILVSHYGSSNTSQPTGSQTSYTNKSKNDVGHCTIPFIM